MRRLTVLPLILVLLWLPLLGGTAPSFPAASMREVPVAHQGRFREISAYADLWWYDLYHSTQIRKQDRPELGASSSEEMIWNFQFNGHTPWDNAPVFWMNNPLIKELAGLPQHEKRFSYNAIVDGMRRPSFLGKLAALEFSKQFYDSGNRSQSRKLELKTLAPGLWLAAKGNTLEVLSVSSAPWDNLPVGPLQETLGPLSSLDSSLLSEMHALLNSLRIYESLLGAALPQEAALSQAIKEWTLQGIPPNEIARLAEERFPARNRLQQAGTLLKVLPGKRTSGEWYALDALNVQAYDKESRKLVPVSNFTVYPDSLFSKIRKTYEQLQHAVLSKDAQHIHMLADLLGGQLREGYSALAGTPLRQSEGKTLYYPTINQLKAEAFYYKYPLTEIGLLLYGAALCGFILALSLRSRRFEIGSTAILVAAFLVHTLVIAMRCYILNRPPVSNMFETVIYVPWIAVLLSFILHPFLRTPLLYISSSLVALALLVVLKISNINSSMENVQAVLDSQYWLIIHVMMIVGSYGVFALSGILAHIYIVGILIEKNETPWLKYSASCVLQTLYIGVALLIPGTILGGVWAAQSWGRFWDWDPKESWAFISSCVYLIGVHAYRFGFVGNFGLAASSIVGLMSISFTWYGVNYLLGTGLHSYGFGSGGNGYYYAYLLAECVFLVTAWALNKIFLRKKGKTRYE